MRGREFTSWSSTTGHPGSRVLVAYAALLRLAPSVPDPPFRIRQDMTDETEARPVLLLIFNPILGSGALAQKAVAVREIIVPILASERIEVTFLSSDLPIMDALLHDLIKE